MPDVKISIEGGVSMLDFRSAACFHPQPPFPPPKPKRYRLPPGQKCTADLSLSDSDGLRSRYIFAKGGKGAQASYLRVDCHGAVGSAVGRHGRSASAVHM